MIETLRNAWKIEDLRKKILYTILIIAVFRIGAVIPVPFIDASYLSSMFSDSGNLMGYFNMITGGSFQRATIFALSITPYINASIIIQLLTVAIPPLEKLAQEGPEGQKKDCSLHCHWLKCGPVHCLLLLTQALRRSAIC